MTPSRSASSEGGTLENGVGTDLRAVPFPVVLAGPSGAGKTTLCRRLFDLRDDLRFSVSATTRAPRPEEGEGRDYRFVSREAFDRMARRGELLEWAEVHGERYGTPRSELETARSEGKHLLLDIDVQGARSVRHRVPEAVTVFILPPSAERVVERLRGRGSESEKALRGRLKAAVAELGAIGEFDYVVVNDDLERAVAEIDAVLSAESRRVSRAGGRAVARARELADEIERVLT